MSDDVSVTTPVEPSTSANEQAPTTTPSRSVPRLDGIIVWAVLSLAFLAYIAVGSIRVQFWGLDDTFSFYIKRIESRSVLHVWSYEIGHLPEVTHQWALNAAFGGAAIVMILGIIAGIWLMLDEVGTGRAQPATRDTTTSVDKA